MNIVIVRTDKAYLPETYAYRAFLMSKGHAVAVVAEREVPLLSTQPDIYYRFSGFLWNRLSSKIPEIHEYGSASVAAYPKIKNNIKSLFSTRPSGRVFLSDTVRKQFNFIRSAPFIFRDMGASEGFFLQRGSVLKKYDLVYPGSVDGRPGLLKCITDLASNGLSIGVAGALSEHDRSVVALYKNIDYVGRLEHDSVPAFVAKARFGLNYCPDIYPYNIQTSTKVIEYLAAGIGIVSNSYSWIRHHSICHNYSYIDVNKINNPDDLREFPGALMDIKTARQFHWGQILERSGFEDFILRCISSNGH